MPTWITLVMALLSDAPEMVTELEALFKALQAMKVGSGTVAEATQAAKALVGAVAASV